MHHSTILLNTCPDPFDRLLIAQAQHEGMTLLTADANIRQYDVATLW